MTTFKVYKPKVESEQEVYFKLVERGKSVLLQVVDENGKFCVNGHILEITEDGELWIFSGVKEKFGFKLDKEGKIKIIQ